MPILVQWLQSHVAVSASATFAFSAGSGYFSPADWQTANWNVLGDSFEPLQLGDNWSTTMSASGQATLGYGYSTNSNFSSASGWISTGSGTAAASGETYWSLSGRRQQLRARFTRIW